MSGPAAVAKALLHAVAVALEVLIVLCWLSSYIPSLQYLNVPHGKVKIQIHRNNKAQGELELGTLTFTSFVFVFFFPKGMDIVIEDTAIKIHLQYVVQ